jgi:ABC-2 type transport system ATP-binding protein
MNVIEITNLKKHFGRIKAVDDITFSIGQGEVFGYLGPNGAGKTTTITCMMGFLKPTAGTITILGKDALKQRTELKKDIGYLASDVYLYRNLTVREHLNLIENIHGKSPVLTKLLDDFSLDPKMKAEHLSTGTKQKLGIIMCFMTQPKLLILDEPTRGLDPLLQKVVYQYIKNFKKNGSTIFISSHNLGEVEKICDHIGIIKSGKLEAVETMSSFKKKKIHIIRAVFKKIPEQKVFRINGVESIKQINHNEINIRVKGNINEILKLITKYDLDDIEISHASLEELFIEYYQ